LERGPLWADNQGRHESGSYRSKSNELECMSDQASSHSDLTDPLAAESDCPLPAAQQSRNILCFAGFWCVVYLAAPVSYVGVTHANLLKELGNSDTVANLPHAVYQWLTAFPVLVAWFLPQPKLLKPLLVVPLLMMASVSAAVAVAIGCKLSPSAVTVGVIAHGAVFGASNGVLITTLWEVLRRGVSTSRRGQALGMTFGVGPLLACVGSLAQQALFSKGPIGGISLGLTFPQNYLVLFAAAVPLALLAMVATASFVVPLPQDEPHSEPRLHMIMNGLRQFFTYRPVVMGAVAYLLVYSGGNAIFDNVSMHAKEVLGEQSAGTLGVQNFLRFGFKAATGVFLGWLLTKTNPKATLLATTAILLFAMGWVLNASGWWYLLSAGLLGSGELFGAYFPNYITTASAKSQVRTNIAYLNLLGAFVGFASVLFGQISDRFGRIASFHTATGLLILAMLLILVALPARPSPRENTLPRSFTPGKATHTVPP
jgi:MFS family permease